MDAILQIQERTTEGKKSKNIEKKGLVEIATEIQELAQKARDKQLAPGDMQGGTFTVSSLGGISGTNFTPIINIC